MLAAAAGPDPTLTGIATIIAAVGGLASLTGIVLTFVISLRQNRTGTERRRGRRAGRRWPDDARERVAELERERDAATAEATAWQARWEDADAERLKLLRERRRR